MNKLFEWGNQYVRESDWKDLALVKFCLCAMGIIIGMRKTNMDAGCSCWDYWA